MDLSAGAAARLGALIGAAAGVGGTVLTGYFENQRLAARTHRSRVQAARAWRDDIYEVQSALAEALLSEERPDLRRALRSRMGTDTTFLELAAAIPQGENWWRVARGRRDLVELLEVRQAVRRWKPATLRYFFWRWEEARLAIATVDDDWPATAHGDGLVMGPPPGRENAAGTHSVKA